MEKIIDTKKKILFILAVIIVLFLIAAVFLLTQQRTQPGQSEPKPTQSAVKQIPSSLPIPGKYEYRRVESVPTLPPQSGQGVDVDSEEVNQSRSQIADLSAYLPYNKDLKLADGRTVSIVIPSLELQTHDWIMLVQVFGIDYQLKPTDEGYTMERVSFREAAEHIFSWMRSQGVDHSKIIISWGDRNFIQKRATEWLTSE